MVYDFDLSFATQLQPQTNVSLRKWAGLMPKSDEGVLYRSRSLFGLQLTSLKSFFMRMQVTKCHLLENSADGDIRLLYEQRMTQEAPLTVWRPTQTLREAEAVVDHKLKFPGQQGRLGLGHGSFTKAPSNPENESLLVPR